MSYLFALCFIIHCVYGVQFSFVPSPNITILQSAVYQCTVDGVGPSDSVSVQWTVNSISSSSPSWPSYASNYSIVVDGIGTQSSTLTIPGDTALNGTTVQCIASGIVNGQGYVNTSSDTLYMQGKPHGVDLNCIISMVTIQCNWSIPYTLPGVDITGYNINITNGTNNNLIMNTTVNETQYAFDVSEFSEYCISVAAIVREYAGAINFMKVIAPEVQITNWSINVTDETLVNISMDQIFSESLYLSKIILRKEHNPQVLGTKDKMKEKSSTISGETLSLITNERGIQNVSLTVEYQNGLKVDTNNSREINTFSVRKVHIEDNSNTDTNGQVCFKCEYAPFVKNPIGCYVIFNCTETELEGNLTIYNQSFVCRNDLTNSLYNIYGFDVVNKTIFSEPAYKIIGTQIGRIVTSTKGYSSHYSSASSTLTEPTESLENNGINLTLLYIIASITIIFLSLVVILIIYFLLRKYKKQKLLSKATAIQLHYVEAEINTNGPKPSFINANITYTTVQSSIGSTQDVYNKLNREQLVPNYQLPAVEQYSTLQENNSLKNDETRKYSTLPGQVSISKLTYKFMVDNISSKIPYKWKEFGEQVAIIPPKLIEIQNNHPHNDEHKFYDVIHEWQTCKTTKPFTWATLHEVLISIKEEELLSQL